MTKQVLIGEDKGHTTLLLVYVHQLIFDIFRDFLSRKGWLGTCVLYLLRLLLFSQQRPWRCHGRHLRRNESPRHDAVGMRAIIIATWGEAK